MGTFPIGIDPEKFLTGLLDADIMTRIEVLRARFKGAKLLIGVDRLDYIKGVPQKLHALELFLTKHPEWQEKVVLVQSIFVLTCSCGSISSRCWGIQAFGNACE